MVDAAELRDLIKEYGASIEAARYEILVDFGIWYADKAAASGVVLSDWTPQAIKPLTGL